MSGRYRSQTVPDCRFTLDNAFRKYNSFSGVDVFTIMTELGYQAFNLSLRRRGGLQGLFFSIASLDLHGSNVVCCHPQHPLAPMFMGASAELVGENS